MKITYSVLWELVLVFASVLIFRSAWMLLDQISVLSTPAVLFFSLIVGVVFGSLSLHRLYVIK